MFSDLRRIRSDTTMHHAVARFGQAVEPGDPCVGTGSHVVVAVQLDTPRR